MPDVYADWLSQLAALMRAELPVPPTDADEPLPPPRAAAPLCLILSPHPDDECIVGALPLRLRREAGWRVVNLAVTLGSKPERRDARLAELRAACGRLGFEIALPAPEGLQHIQPQLRETDAAAWQTRVDAVAQQLQAQKPALLLLPHALDGSATHQGVHQLGMDAIQRAGLPVMVAFTEYWSTLPAANLLVETSLADTARLVRALACHVGEVARNPYHLRLPAWFADSVRRGGELVMGAGAAVPNADFATLYQLQAFDGQGWLPAEAPRFIDRHTAAGLVAEGIATAR
jgi:LmbE family N-acetylglucosaminyl deacetylase